MNGFAHVIEPRLEICRSEVRAIGEIAEAPVACESVTAERYGNGNQRTRVIADFNLYRSWLSSFFVSPAIKIRYRADLDASGNIIYELSRVEDGKNRPPPKLPPVAPDDHQDSVSRTALHHEPNPIVESVARQNPELFSSQSSPYSLRKLQPVRRHYRP